MNTRTRRAGAAAVAAVAAGAVSFFGAGPASAAEPTGLGLCRSVAGLSPGQAAGVLGMSVNRVVAKCGHVLAAPETQSPAPAPLLGPLVGGIGQAVGGTVNSVGGAVVGGSPSGVLPQTPGAPAPGAPAAPPAAAVGPAPVSGPYAGALLTPAQFMSYDLGALGGAAFARYDLAMFPGFGSGRIPTFGLLGAEPGAGSPSDVAAAGSAQALPADVARLAPQVMAAVLVLAGVSAVFVRSWVLSGSTARRPRGRRA